MREIEVERRDGQDADLGGAHAALVSHPTVAHVHVTGPNYSRTGFAIISATYVSEITTMQLKRFQLHGLHFS